MNGVVTIALLTNFGIISFARHDLSIDINDIVVYAKPAYKISAGSAAKLGQFPWAVALTIITQKDYNYCGGSIISKRHILTAAHCIMKYAKDELPCTSAKNFEDITRIAIRYGGICIRKNSPLCDGKLCMTTRTRKIAVHRRFMDQGCIQGYDFALIETEDDLMFDSTTSAICLPNSTLDLNSIGNLFDYGFGENEHGEKMSRLNYGSVKIINVHKVKDFIRVGPIFKLTNKTYHHGICTGDSGAGLQGMLKQRVFLLGIHSFGPKVCYDGSPFTVTDVRPYAQLICKLTGICYHLSL